MYRIFVVLVVAVLAVPAQAGWNVIESEAELAKYVVGKSFEDPKSKAWFRLRKNGKLAGALTAGS